MIKDAIVEKIEQICSKREISYTELARLSGITPSTIYSMLDPKRRNLNVSTLKKICDGLDIRLKYFFDDSIFDNLPQEIE